MECIEPSRMEKVLADLYDVLGQLSYPEISKIDAKDLAANVLAGQNRITLLSWLLSHASATLSSHLEKFQGASLKDEVVKCYLQIGISNDENMLLGNCSTKHQLATLKALLVFAKSLNNMENETIDDTLVNEVLDKHINESINIIPTSCHVSMKLTDNEVKKYLEEVEQNINKPAHPSPVCRDSETDPVASKDATRTDNKEIENEQTLSLDSISGAFSTAFESAESWRNSKSPNKSAICESVNLDETIKNLSKDLSYLIQVFESKKAIMEMRAIKCLEKSETPLSLLIEDNVIFTEEIRTLYDQN